MIKQPEEWKLMELNEFTILDILDNDGDKQLKMSQ
jgi:hypothetical protein